MLLLIPHKISIFVVLGAAFAIILAGNAIKSQKLSSMVKIFGYLLLLLPSILYFLNLGVVDLLSSLFSMLTAIVGAAVTAFTNIYEVRKYRERNLRILIDVFILTVYAVFVSPNLLSFIMFWLFAEIVGFFAIVFEIHRRTLVAGLRYLLVSMVPADIALLTLIAATAMNVGFQEALALPIDRVSQYLGQLNAVLSLILFLGFMAKAAVAPFHFWLPDAHSLAPAPASAILSGVMVKMGIYGIIRTLPAISSEPVLYAVLILSSMTVVYGGLQALVQNDIKRLLAYSTIENTSLMVLALALYKLTGISMLFTATIMFVFAHGVFKAALFMNSGIVEVSTHTRELTKLGYLSKFLPIPSISALIAVLSLLGVPPTLGFLAKLYLLAGIIEAIYVDTGIGVLTLIIASIGVGLAVMYGVKYLTVYWGSLESKHHSVETLSEGLLIKSELGLSLMSVVLSVPLFILFTIGGLSVLEPLYLASLVMIEAAFLILLYYIYTRAKSIAQEVLWIGGVTP